MTKTGEDNSDQYAISGEITMFGKFKLFGKKTTTKTEEVYAPGTKIPYDQTLVKRLKGDHQELLNLFMETMRLIDKREYNKIWETNDKFLGLFNAHILLEYTKLYVFLEYTFKDEQDYYTVISEFRREMNQIGRAVREFYKRWQTAGLHAENIEAFKEELGKIGEVLVKRVETEENRLYEIYDLSPGLLSRTVISHTQAAH